MARRTAILATLGPATADRQGIRGLIDAGADALRLNFSHGTHETHRAMVELIRAAAAEAGRPIAILQDLGGPKVRIGAVEPSQILLKEGDTLVVEHGDFVGGPGRVSCAVEAFFAAMSRGVRVLVDDGKIELEVTAAGPGRVSTRVVNGGPLSGGKGLNVPGVALPISALTPKDREDLAAGVAMGVDLVALSFVQSAGDVELARAALVELGAPDMPIIAKIEKPLAVDDIDAIVSGADGVMVARGDLGIEMPLETLPAVQKRIVQAARRRGVPVIVATQVLESMREEPRPTRAEVTDAAHAVDESVDAIMLSGETAVGKYPERAVRTLDAIITEAERALKDGGQVTLMPRIDPAAVAADDHGVALCEAAVTLATRAGAVAIVAMTSGGKTARLLAALRPEARVLAATANARVAPRLALVWGTTPLVVDALTFASVREALRARQLVPDGAVVVFVSIDPVLGREDSNFTHIERF